ncbi:MAG TPA: glycosyltransferase [Bacteroidetes bacterium]|nr:glycosyltransferase [Bacteroidota bacterium]
MDIREPEAQEEKTLLLSEEQPLVSVVIPMFNERRNIGACLESLLRQDYPLERLEICVVDGDSTDGSAEIVRDYAQRFPNIRLLRNPDRITPKALNIGARAARGEVIIILGAHTQVKEDFVAKNVRYLREKNVPCVGGTQINLGETYVQQAIGHAMASPFGITSAPYRYRRKAGFVDTVVYAAYHRKLFDEVGYFDEEKLIAEDAEFNWRIRKAGYRIFFTPEIVSYYVPRKNFLHLARQFFRYGILRVNVVKKHLDAVKLLHLIPPAFVLALLLSGIFSLFSQNFRPIFILLLAAYGVYLLIASVTTAARSGWKYLPLLPIAFMTMQLSFGAGFLVGLFKSHH